MPIETAHGRAQCLRNALDANSSRALSHQRIQSGFDPVRTRKTLGILCSGAPDTGSAVNFSDFTKSGAMAFPDVLGPIFDEINEKYGTDVKPIFTK